MRGVPGAVAAKPSPTQLQVLLKMDAGWTLELHGILHLMVWIRSVTGSTRRVSVATFGVLRDHGWIEEISLTPMFRHREFRLSGSGRKVLA